MTDKEWLEDLKDQYHFYVDKGIAFNLEHSDIEYLFKQAERVQELESLCKQLVGEEWMNDEGLYESEMMKLENKYLALRNIHNITLKTGELVAEENKQQKQALEKIREMSKDSVIDRKYFEIADEALEDEE
ncbi:MAG: hypothetical protein ACFWT6_12060 [Virgibacillus proomii]|jgi:hypothetical protein